MFTVRASERGPPFRVVELRDNQIAGPIGREFRSSMRSGTTDRQGGGWRAQDVEGFTLRADSTS